TGFQLPVIYAGNADAREEVDKVLSEKTALTVTENIRPTMEAENLGPARHVIHDLFLEHVMAQAPGYRKLMGWTGAPIMPTPGAVGQIMQTIARQQGINVVGVDIGGATTDVFSVFGEIFNRTVSANLGMSYSISNVLAEAGLDAIMRWVAFDLEEADLRDRIKNKMIRPTTIPQLLQELQIEQAIAREALRLAFVQHRELAVGLKGVQSERTLADVFEQGATGESLIHMMELDLLVGSGGVLSHAPNRQQSCAMLIDAFQPEGITRLAVDSIFMMPHLGVLSTVDEQAATEVFERDCLIYLGTCAAPVGEGKFGEVCAEYAVDLAGGRREGELRIGELVLLPLEDGETAQMSLRPGRGWDAGAGPGQAINAVVHGGAVGLVLDGRGRPIELAPDDRLRQMAAWQGALNLYGEQ
ncbi:MAG: glutamate mutase L, partial [Candidatus Latescibacteria bacterium]|nr:glutamate mutase L [Candidatus Latescibacterota bacterium]